MIHLNQSDIYQEDESWSLQQRFSKFDDALHPTEIESSFILALKNGRYRSLDHIFTKHQRDCVTELATLVKTDPKLSLKWNVYLGLDLYLPTLLVWLIYREKARPDVKRRLAKPKGFLNLPFY